MLVLGDHPSPTSSLSILFFLSFSQAIKERGIRFYTTDDAHLLLKSHFNMFILDTRSDANSRPIFFLNLRPKVQNVIFLFSFFLIIYIFFFNKIIYKFQQTQKKKKEIHKVQRGKG